MSSTASLGATLVDSSQPLALRFRALFSLKALGTQGDSAAIDAIARGFTDDSELLKHELAYVLGQTKQQSAIPHLTAVLEDLQQQAMVRHEAAEALGAIGDDRCLATLTHYEKREGELEVVRQTCELARARIEWLASQRDAANADKLEKSNYSSIDPAPPTVASSTESSEQEIARLQKELNDQALPLFQRYRAMFRLRDIGTEPAVLALATGFDNDPSALFKHEVAYVFGQMSHPASVPALVKVLQDTREEAMVRHEAAEALGSIATDDVVEVLKKFEADPERVVRESCIVANDMAEYERSDELQYATIPVTA
ncbi:deoxyhypusine hydroxylase [Savitreella phatthalungensis]